MRGTKTNESECLNGVLCENADKKGHMTPRQEHLG